jgi:xylulokinase
MLWQTILASVFNSELITISTTEGAAFGAALLAAVGVKNWEDIPSACRQAVKITGSTQPNTIEVEAYTKSYALYRELYPALKASFGKMD